MAARRRRSRLVDRGGRGRCLEHLRLARRRIRYRTHPAHRREGRRPRPTARPPVRAARRRATNRDRTTTRRPALRPVRPRQARRLAAPRIDRFGRFQLGSRPLRASSSAAVSSARRFFDHERLDRRDLGRLERRRARLLQGVQLGMAGRIAQQLGAVDDVEQRRRPARGHRAPARSWPAAAPPPRR